MDDSDQSAHPQTAPASPASLPSLSSPRSSAGVIHPLAQQVDEPAQSELRHSMGRPATPNSPAKALGRAFERSGSQVSLTPLGDTARGGLPSSSICSTTSIDAFPLAAIQAGEIGAAYGRYPRHESLPTSPSAAPLFSRRSSHMSSDVAIDLLSRNNPDTSTSDLNKSDSRLDLPRVPYALRSSASSSYGSLSLLNQSDAAEVYDTHNPPTSDDLDNLRSLPALSKPFFPGNAGIRRSELGLDSQSTPAATEDIRFYLWEKGNEDVDDYLHEPEEQVDKLLDRQARIPTWRAVADTASLIIVVLVCLGVFLGWPVLRFGILGTWQTAHHGGSNSILPGHGPGGINASGQVPLIPGNPGLIDVDTPLDAYSFTSEIDGERYNLVFSDEFNKDGRTFWPGDDPYWEAVDLHYWQTQDYEWYDPDAIVTKDGSLQITLTQEPWNNLNFRSGMLQSWNKFCFTSGRIEVRCSFPGNSRAMGYWPGAWTMGNLGRPGYGGSNHGVWPYSYNSCDVGTLPNQTYQDADGPRRPSAARTSGLRDYGGQLSYLAGQRFSACTCDGEDHPGPRTNIGRGAPEIDITEQQVDWRGTGSTSQSMQFAPMGAGYGWNRSSEWTIFNDNITVQNLFTGAVNQESASVITLTDTTSYEGQGYSTFAFEYEPGADGRVTWFVNNTPSWQITGAAIGPDAETEVGQRLISVEPMSITINLAISPAFQPPDWQNIRFPGTFRVDYVRVYQKGEPNVGCDPEDYPTANYIQRNLDVYTNANYTTFPRAFPKNSMSAAGCS
ncbi:hypothetical protein JCM11251_005442 [Rhodosporidiobolus azoricus]